MTQDDDDPSTFDGERALQRKQQEEATEKFLALLAAHHAKPQPIEPETGTPQRINPQTERSGMSSSAGWV